MDIFETAKFHVIHAMLKESCISILFSRTLPSHVLGIRTLIPRKRGGQNNKIARRNEEEGEPQMHPPLTGKPLVSWDRMGQVSHLKC